MFYVAACGEECPEVATQDYSDVEDIPIPSQIEKTQLIQLEMKKEVL